MSEKITSACEYADNPNRLATDEEKLRLHNAMVLLAVSCEVNIQMDLDQKGRLNTNSGETLTYRKECRPFEVDHKGNPHDFTTFSVTYRSSPEKITDTTKSTQRLLQWTVTMDSEADEERDTYTVIDEVIIIDSGEQQAFKEPEPNYVLSGADSATFDYVTSNQLGTYEQYVTIYDATCSMIKARSASL